MYLDHCAREMMRANGTLTHSVFSHELSLLLQSRYQSQGRNPTSMFWGELLLRSLLVDCYFKEY